MFNALKFSIYLVTLTPEKSHDTNRPRKTFPMTICAPPTPSANNSLFFPLVLPFCHNKIPIFHPPPSLSICLSLCLSFCSIILNVGFGPLIFLLIPTLENTPLPPSPCHASPLCARSHTLREK